MAVRNINEYPRVARRLAKAIEEFSGDLLKSAAVGVAAQVISSTPVDTGQARSNWLASVNAPRLDTRGPVSRNPAAIVAEVTAIYRSAGPDDTLYLSNNLDYIGALNANPPKSTQARAGFIRRAVIQGALRGVRDGLRFTLCSRV